MGRQENIKRMKRLKELKKQRERQAELDSIANKATEKLLVQLSKENNNPIVRNKGKVKYSELLQELVAPYLNGCRDYKEVKNLLHAGALAWNMSVIRESVVQEEVAQVVDDFKKIINGDEYLYSSLEDLINRKEQLFKNHMVIIAGLEVTETEKNYGISVAVAEIE